MINHLFLVYLILFPANLSGTGNAETSSPNHYQIHLTIDPGSQFIEVEGNLKMAASDSITDQLSFRLHNQFTIETFSINAVHDFITDTTGGTYTPNSKELIFNLGEPVKKGDTIYVEFKYSGNITRWFNLSANVITPDWVEIGLYFPWFPNGSGSLPATYNLIIECPSEYQVFGMGEIRNQDTVWHIEQKEPTNDIVVFASNDMNIRETHLENLGLTIFYHNMADSAVDAFSSDLKIIYNLFSEWFGQIQGEKLYLIESKREIGGGYARTGEIILPSFRTKDYFSNRLMHNAYIGHEMGHFWWSKANTDTWQDWLNEAFAEYSSLLIVREVFGADAFEEQLLERKKNIDQTKPIWGIQRTDPEAYYVLYHKGALLLNELESRIGKTAFLKLCQLIFAKNVDNTAEFLTLLMSLEGKEISDWFEQSLKLK